MFVEIVSLLVRLPRRLDTSAVSLEFHHPVLVADQADNPQTMEPSESAQPCKRDLERTPIDHKLGATHWGGNGLASVKLFESLKRGSSCIH